MSPNSVTRHGRTNAVLGWSLTAVVGLAGVADLLAGAWIWGGFWLVAVAAIALPAALTRDWRVIVPWPLPLCALVAVALRAAAGRAELAGYVGVVTVALVATIALDRFTAVDMSRRFAVAFAAMTTMAVQAWWAVAQFVSDAWFGTAYLRSESELQWDVVAVVAVALVVGGFFVWYLERFDHFGPNERPLVPEESP